LFLTGFPDHLQSARILIETQKLALAAVNELALARIMAGAGWFWRSGSMTL
jgi:hypothetical protein